MTDAEEARQHLTRLLVDLEEKAESDKYANDTDLYWPPVPEIDLAYYDGGSQVHLRKLIDLIVDAGWRPSI